MLWFDVGIKRYTTSMQQKVFKFLLWFDVGIKRYTTGSFNNVSFIGLWFDVGIKRYTTKQDPIPVQRCCGLMQESKDIQLIAVCPSLRLCCGLMQESKDIQLQPPRGYSSAGLWFDVGIKRYTTKLTLLNEPPVLWFDVGIKRYTTFKRPPALQACCGLMQESKDIQLLQRQAPSRRSCGLMQESKDIQLNSVYKKL